MKKSKIEKTVELNRKRSQTKKAYNAELKAQRGDTFVGYRPSTMQDKRRKKKAEQRLKNELRRTYA